MKKHFLLLFTCLLAFCSCDSNDSVTDQDSSKNMENILVGVWSKASIERDDLTVTWTFTPYGEVTTHQSHLGHGDIIRTRAYRLDSSKDTLTFEPVDSDPYTWIYKITKLTDEEMILHVVSYNDPVAFVYGGDSRYVRIK